jgi:exosome complex exonuclease RRP6
MFDTFHASRALDLPRHSLAFLLSVYCDFTADKRYQLADWRIRPLPAEMLHYARSDTHFLLFVYDNLREALLDRGKSHPDTTMDVDQSSEVVDEARFVKDVLKKSEETALREYVRESYDEGEGEGKRGWAFLIRKWNKNSLAVDGVPRRMFLAVHRWRDQVSHWIYFLPL